jgi:hypothetical protein
MAAPVPTVLGRRHFSFACQGSRAPPERLRAAGQHAAELTQLEATALALLLLLMGRRCRLDVLA